PRLLTAGLALLAACSNPVDRAAKERIFSPEAPPAVVASAKESLDPQKLASDSKLAHRVVDMGSAEVTERIGPHRFSAEVAFTWTAGKDTVKLTETRLLESAAGGVSGDFHARIENSRDQGLEVVRARGQVFARSKFGKYRLRLRDRGMAERTRDETAGPLRELDGLFRAGWRSPSRGRPRSRDDPRSATPSASPTPPETSPPAVRRLPPPATRVQGSTRTAPGGSASSTSASRRSSPVRWWSTRQRPSSSVPTWTVWSPCPETRASPRRSSTSCSISASRTSGRPSPSRSPRGTCRMPTSRRASPTPSTASASSGRRVPTVGWTPRQTRTPPDRPGLPGFFRRPGAPRPKN